jgi:DNA-binding NarL/FixJ family response regulator
MLVVCPHCQTHIKVQIDLSVELESQKIEPVSPLERIVKSPDSELDSKRVMVAINGEGTREIVRELLEEALFEVQDVSSLGVLFSQLATFRPATILVDLSLPNATEIKLHEVIAKDLSPNKANLLLLSPGYGKASISPEKQIPFSGADGYIERSNIQRDLINKIKLCLSPNTDFPILTPQSSGAEHASSRPVFEEEKRTPATTTPTMATQKSDAPVIVSPSMGVDSKDRAVEKANRLARIIVSDIVLYNEKKVEEGVANGTFYELLKEELEEGRKHYNSRIALDIQQQKDYFGDVLEDFLKKRKGVLV